MDMFELRMVCEYTAEEVETYEADIIKLGSTYNIRNLQTTNITALNQPHKLEANIQNSGTNISIMHKETPHNEPRSIGIYVYSGDIRNNTNEHIESNIEGRYLGVFNIESDDFLSSPGSAYLEIWGERTSPERDQPDILTESMLEEYRQAF